MQILIFNTYYFPKFVGGAEISVQLLAEGLVKTGNKVYVITFGDYFAIDRVKGVIVIRIKQRNIFSYFNSSNHFKPIKLLWHLIDSCNPFYYYFIKAIIDRIKPDVVHTNNILGFSASIWAIIKTRKIPLLHTIRDYYILCHRCNLFNEGHNCQTLCKDCNLTHLLKNNFINYPDSFVGISDFIIRKHRHLIDSSKLTRVIYNGVDCNHNLKSHAPAEKMVFGYLGRVSIDKGVEYLVKELANCSNTIKNKFKLLIAGKGDNDFINHLKTLGASFELIFLGAVKSDDFFKQIDLLMVPSLWAEPFGRTVIEAFSYKIPVCMADSGGLKELYNENCSWLYTPASQQLQNLIEEGVINIASIMQKSERCLDSLWKFSESGYVKSYQDAYNDVIHAGSLNLLAE